jgi:hypothetical protein
MCIGCGNFSSVFFSQRHSVMLVTPYRSQTWRAGRNRAALSVTPSIDVCIDVAPSTYEGRYVLYTNAAQ